MAFNIRLLWNMLSLMLLAMSLYLVKSIWTFREEADKVGIKYNSFTDLYSAGGYLLLIICVRYVAELYLKPILVERLRQVDQLNFNVKKDKVTKEFISFLWYVFITIYGNIALYNHSYIPTYLNGSSTCEDLTLDYARKSGDPVINKYYMIETAHHMFSLLHHLFVAKRTQDFSEMSLHHFCAMAAIIFSYYTNQVPFGATILLAHDYGDIFLNLGKFLKDTKVVPQKISFIVDIVFVNIFVWWFFPRVVFISACVLPAGVYYRHFNHTFDPELTALRDSKALVDALQIFMVFVIMLLNLWWSWVILNIGLQRLKAKNGSEFVVYVQGEKYKAESPSAVAADDPSASVKDK